MSVAGNHSHNWYQSITKDQGVRTAVNGRIGWTERFIVIAIGNPLSQGLTNGYLSINPLTANSTVKVLGSNGAADSTRAVDASGTVQLNAWESLCYRVDMSAAQASIQTQFFITPTYNRRFHLNENTIVVCHRGRDNLKWCDGYYTDTYNNPVEAEAARADFWRKGDATLTTLPEGGQGDETTAAMRRGKVGIGQVSRNPAWTPVAQLDVSSHARSSNVNHMATDSALRLTGNLWSIASVSNYNQPTDNDAWIGHTNETQGIGFGYDGLYAAGTNTNQNFGIAAKGTGYHIKQFPNAANPFDYRTTRAGSSINRAFYDRDYFGTLEVSRVIRGYHMNAAGSLTSTIWQQQLGGLRSCMRLQPSPSGTQNASLSIDENRIHRDKLNLYNQGGSNQYQIMAIGVESNNDGAMTYQTYSNWSHRFYNSDDATFAGSRLLMEVQANGRVCIGSQATGTKYNAAGAQLDVRKNAVIGNVTNHTFRNNSTATSGLTIFTDTPAVANAKTAEVTLRGVSELVNGVSYAEGYEFRLGSVAKNGTNANSQMELWMNSGTTYTPNVKVMHFRADGRINTPSLPTFNNDTAAGTGGLVAGDWYKTSAGDLKIKL